MEAEEKVFEGILGRGAGPGATGSVSLFSSTAITRKHWLLTPLVGIAPSRDAGDVWILAAGWTGG